MSAFLLMRSASLSHHPGWKLGSCSGPWLGKSCPLTSCPEAVAPAGPGGPELCLTGSGPPACHTAMEPCPPHGLLAHYGASLVSTRPWLPAVLPPLSDCSGCSWRLIPWGSHMLSYQTTPWKATLSLLTLQEFLKQLGLIQF